MTAYMEYDLRRGYDNYTTKRIYISKALEWFHRCLACGLVKVCTFCHVITFSKFCLHISYPFVIGYANIAFVILSYRDIIVNIIFRMYYSFMVDSSVHIKYRFLYFVFNLDKRHCFKRCSLIFCYDKSYFVSNIANYRVQDECIISGWLWICLTC